MIQQQTTERGTRHEENDQAQNRLNDNHSSDPL